MKIKELKENESLEVIRITKHFRRPDYPLGLVKEEDSIANMTKDNNSNFYEEDRIQTKIYTDGEIVTESDEVTEGITEFFINDKINIEKYSDPIDTIRKRKVSLKNYSYVVVYLITNIVTTYEMMSGRKIKGRFNVVGDVTIYLKDLKDRQSLKKAKEIIKTIKKVQVASQASTKWVHGIQDGKQSPIVLPVKEPCQELSDFKENFDGKEISKDIFYLSKRIDEKK